MQYTRHIYMKRFIATIPVAFVLYVLSMAPSVFASGAGDTGGANPTDIQLTNPLSGNVNDVPSLLNKIIQYLQIIAVPLLTIAIIAGAFQMLTAGGDEAKFKKGKKTITYAAIGAAVIMAASGIILIIKQFLGATS